MDGNEVVAVDPITGTSKFTIPVPGDYPSSGIEFVQPIIAGDGYAYVPFVYRSSDCINVSLDMLRISSTGAYDRIPVITRPTHTCEWEGIVANVITNADSGVLLSWKSTDYQQSSNVDTYGMAIAAGTTVSLVNAPQLPGQNGPVIPVLQAEDGSYIGTVDSDTGGIVGFDGTGAVRWTLPGYWQPEIATAAGGVIATQLDADGSSVASVTFDQNGNATEQMPALAAYSWTDHWYEVGSVNFRFRNPLDIGLSFQTARGGNLGHTSTSIKLIRAKVFLPEEIADLTKPGTLPQTANFAAELSTHSTGVLAIEPLPFNKATMQGFMAALNTTNMFVAYIGHGVVTTDASNVDHASALRFAKGAYLQPGQEPVASGVTPRAKVVFLGACGLDDAFLSQWHLKDGADGQALISPVYSPQNKNLPRQDPLIAGNTIDLFRAALDVQYLLDQFTQPGKTVGGALYTVNQSDLGEYYSWQVKPSGGSNVSFKP